MKNNQIQIFLLVTCVTLLVPHSKADANVIEADSMSTEYIQTRASRIILNSGWRLYANSCDFSLSFLSSMSGTGTVILQKKNGSSWKEVGRTKISFIDTWSFDGEVSVSGLSSGTYRLEYNLTSGVTETIHSLEKTL